MSAGRWGAVFAGLNRSVQVLLLIGAVVFAGAGLYLGVFAWMNDGAVAALRLIGTTLTFAAGFGVGALAFRIAALAHAKGDRRRWWIQAGTVVAAYLAFGLAAWSSSLFDRIGKD